MVEESTHRLLKIYFGLESARGIKKNKVYGKLINRGVSVLGMETLLSDLFFQVGNAADNRIEEIDSQLEEEK